MSTSSLQGQIEKIVSGGLRLLRGEKGIVFLNEGLPGETVSYTLDRKQKGTQYGKILEIIHSNTTRIPSPCAHYPPCGGCSLIETTPENRREIKMSMLQDVLRRVGKLDEMALSQVAPIKYEKKPQGRIRATLQMAPDGAYGFYEPQSHNLVPITKCVALHPFLQDFLAALHKNPCPPTHQNWRLQIACDPTGKIGAAIHQLRLEQQQQVAQHLLAHTPCNGVHLLHSDGYTLTTLGDANLTGVIADTHVSGPFGHDPATFTQSSFWGSRVLIETATEFIDQITTPITTCVELFAGAGHFSFELLDRAKDLLCIEGDPRAFFWLSENRGQHPLLDQMEIWQTKVDGQRPDLLPDICPIDLLFMDPPREGVKGLKQITQMLRPHHIVAVSCDMASGARDLGLLSNAGYKLQRLQPLDIFANNHHLEWIAWLTRSNEAD